MNDFESLRNAKLAQVVIKGLASRNMTGHYAASREEALRIALDLIPKHSTITMGGGVSVEEIGLKDALKTKDYTFKIGRAHV
nr:LUD domain-containing protein [uncultured Dubosiella sp.]